MRCNFCGAEWTLPYKMTITECPFCRRTLENPGASTRSSGYIPQSSGTTSTANRQEDFDIVGTILREYKGTNPVVYVPEGITELGMVKPGTGAFYGNNVIQKVILPQSLRKMSLNAFALSSVREVVFSEGITAISERAFYNCKNLKIVNLPASLTEIGYHAFDSTCLESITVPGSVTTIPNGCFRNCTSLRTVSLQKGIKVIGGYSFAGCTALTEVVLPEGTEHLCRGAFLDCYYLKRVVIPDSVVQIEQYRYNHSYSDDPGVFHNCTALIDVIWPSSRFDPIIFKGSLCHEKLVAEQEAREAQQKALEEKRKHDRIMIMNGKCPKCNEDLTFWTNRCRKCGTKY